MTRAGSLSFMIAHFDGRGGCPVHAVGPGWWLRCVPPAGCAHSHWITESPGRSERVGRGSPSTEQNWQSRGNRKFKGTEAYLGRKSHSMGGGGGGGEALRFREGQAEGEPGGRGFSCHTESSGRGTLGPSPEAGAQGALNWSRIVLSMLVACSQARERPQAGEPQAGATERAVAGAGWGEGRGGERGLPVTRKGLAGQGLNSRHGEQCRIRGALSQMRLTFLPASGEAC